MSKICDFGTFWPTKWWFSIETVSKLVTGYFVLEEIALWWLRLIEIGLSNLFRHGKAKNIVEMTWIFCFYLNNCTNGMAIDKNTFFSPALNLKYFLSLNRVFFAWMSNLFELDTFPFTLCGLQCGFRKCVWP